MRKIVTIAVVLLLAVGFFLTPDTVAMDKTITVPAHKPEGVVVELGYDNGRGQGVPNIGTLWVESSPKAMNQVDIEEAGLKALQGEKEGTLLKFSLDEQKAVRFWVSDFDYSDNMGSVRVRVYSTK